MSVKASRAKITKMLAEASPVEALTLEDGVGNTPVETATRQAFLEKLEIVCGNFRQPSELRPNYNQRPFDIEKQEKELPLLHSTIDDLLREGRLTRGTKLTKELLSFADRLEAKLAKEKALAEEQKKKEDIEKVKDEQESFAPARDSGTPSEVLKILLEELAKRPTLRHLVHLSDVHESVKRSLDKFNKDKKNTKQVNKPADDDGLPEEEEVDTSYYTGCYGSMRDSVGRGYYN